jgi:hypothetical protein
MRSRMRTIIVLITLLSLASLACSLSRFIGEKVNEKEDAVPVAKKVELPQAVQLGEEYRSEEGGFVFNTIPEYSIEGFMGFIFMQAPDADEDDGPFVLMMGEQQEEDMTLDSLYQMATSEFDETVRVTGQKDLRIDGYPARSVTVSGTGDSGSPMKGRLVVVLVSERHTLVSFATAPNERWDKELSQAYDALVSSLRFFPPQEINFDFPVDEPVVNETILHQWAMYALASTSYDDPDFGAVQMTGPPDTFVCEDLPTAWASEKADTVETLVLYYEKPVVPLGVYIHQTHAPNQVVEVVLVDIYDNDYLVYKADPWLEPECPYILEVDGFEIDALVDMVVIYIDQSILGTSWNEIDAVELVGIYTEDSPPAAIEAPDISEWANSAFSKSYVEFPGLYEEPGIELEDSTFYILWQSATEDGDFDDIHYGGSRQDQSTSAENVIGMIGPNNRPAVSLFLPIDQQSGSFALKAYDSSSAVKGPTVAMYIGIWLYIAEEGRMEIEVSNDGKVTGKVLAYLVAKDDPQKDAAVYIQLKDMPLKQ